ncbi:hypothetical protein HN873_040007 [Arachis hypogaea]
MINGYCKSKMVDQAITLFKEMRCKSVVPDIVIYNCLVDGFCKLGRIPWVHDLLDEMQKELLHALCKIQHLDEAITLFWKIIDKGFRPNAYMCSILLNGLFKCGRVRTAREFFEHLLINNCCLNVLTYNIMISGLCKEGLMDEAMTLFSKMKGNDCLPNAVNYETIVGALLGSNKNEQAVKLLHEMISEGLKVSKSMTPSEMGQILEWESRSSNERHSVK